MKTQKNFGPILLDGAQAASIYHALIATGNMDLASLILLKSKLTGREGEFAAEARLALDGELEVDEVPVVSLSEDGAFVMAWYWVDASAPSLKYIHQ